MDFTRFHTFDARMFCERFEQVASFFSVGILFLAGAKQLI